MLLRMFIVALALPLGGCGTLDYYWQAIGGQFELWSRTRPIEELLADASVEPATRAKLALAHEARDYAVRALALPENGSYRAYADIGRPFVVWNVFATPELSLTPREWCFPVAGCVGYRGYFSQAAAEAFAAGRAAAGDDVYVAGVAAYSTLGWFDDPLLSTMLRRADSELVALLFHELAHQVVYVKGDSAFNESFATVVELEGVRRWLTRHDDGAAFAAHLKRLHRREQFTQLVLDYRARLEALYRADVADDAKRAGKRALFAELRAAYATLRQTWAGDKRYDSFFGPALNNAHLAAVGTYHRHVGALQALLAQHAGNLPAFYAAVARLARLPAAQREAQLAALAADYPRAARERSRE